jgi:hypothetical protein
VFHEFLGELFASQTVPDYDGKSQLCLRKIGEHLLMIVVNPANVPKFEGQGMERCREICAIIVRQAGHRDPVATLVVRQQEPRLWHALADHSLRGKREVFELVAGDCGYGEFLAWSKNNADVTMGFSERTLESTPVNSCEPVHI